MRSALLRAARNLRAFAHGFLGLAAPPPRDPRAARAHHRERARTRTPCC